MNKPQDTKADAKAEQYTPEEYQEFRELVKKGESQNQVDRIDSRLRFPKFIERIGKAKCDLMFVELCKESIEDDDE